MTENANDNAMPLAAGTLSVDYLSSLSASYAGHSARYAVTSQVQWATFNSGSELERSATADTVDREAIGVTRRGTQKSIAGRPSSELSGREKSCLSWTALGKSSWEIGRILRISENTVIFHIKNAMRKLGAGSRTLAAFRAVELGLIEPVRKAEPEESWTGCPNDSAAIRSDR